MLKATITKVNKWAASITPQRFFLAVVLPLGLLLCVLTPPFMVPDEQAHLNRAYQIAEGGMLPERITQGVGGHLPKSLMDSANALIADLPGQTSKKVQINLVVSELNRPLTPSERIDTHFENTALYSPLIYIPASAGIAIAKIFEPSPLVLLYIGRLFTVLAWIGLIYLAIRLTPIAKWVFAVVALAPMAVFQSASVSADVLTLAAGFVVVAWFIRLVQQPYALTMRDMAITVGLLLLLGFIKQPYGLLGALFLLLPAARFASKKIRWQFVAAASVALLASTLLWASVARNYFTQSPFMVDRVLQPTEQLAYVASEPLAFVKAVLFTHLTGLGDGPITQMIGVFGWLDTALPLWAALIYLAALAVAAGMAYREQTLPLWPRLALIAAGAGVILAIDVLLYMYWNPLKATIIAGIQGRYYLPVLLLVTVATTGLFGVTFKKIKPELVIMGLVVTALLAMVAVLVQRFY